MPDPCRQVRCRSVQTRRARRNVAALLLSTHQVFSALRPSFPPMHKHRPARLARPVSPEHWPFSTLLWLPRTSPFPDKLEEAPRVREANLDPSLLSFEIVRLPGQ